MHLICTQDNGVRFFVEAQKMNLITPRVSDLIKGSIQYTRLRFIFNCDYRIMVITLDFQSKDDSSILSSRSNLLPSSNGQDLWFSSIKSEFDSPWQY